MSSVIEPPFVAADPLPPHVISHGALEFITSRVPGIVFLWKPTADGTSVRFEYSTRVRELFGFDPASLRHARTAFAHVVDEDRDAVREHFRSRLLHRLPVDLEFRVRRGDGTIARVHALAIPEALPDGGWAWSGIYLDITAQHRLEQDLRQSQRLEGLGHLAGSVAHDFNNLLTGIFGYLDLLELNLDDATAEVRADIGEIRAAAERAAWLTRQLLTFSRKQPVSTRDFDVNQIVRKSERFLGRVLGESVNLTVMPSDVPCHVHADSGQLEKGTVRVRSTPGVGSTFNLFLPTARVSASVEECPTDEREPGSSACPGTILLVDDNDSVRMVTRRLLERAGLEVVEARNPAEALAIVEHGSEPFIMLATDLVMSGMSGNALAARMREKLPHLPVLFLSGSPAVSVGEPTPDGPRHIFLAKPYAPGELLKAVSALTADRRPHV